MTRKQSSSVASAALACLVAAAIGPASAVADGDGQLPELEVFAIGATAAGFGAAALRLDLRLPDSIDGAIGTGLESLPGITAGGGFGVIDPPRVSIRGSGIQSAPMSRGFRLFYLGMPFQLADGTINLSLVEPSWSSGAALVRGTAAGVPHLGGALALGSSDDLFATPPHLGIGGGSYHRYDLDAGGNLAAGPGTIALRGHASGGDGWRPRSGWQRESALAAWRAPLGGDATLDLLVLSTRAFLEVPGPLTKSAALATPKAILPRVALDRPERETHHTQLHLAATLRDDETARVALSGGFIHQDDTFVQLLPNGISDTRTREIHLAAEASIRTPGDGRTTAAALLQAGWWEVDRFRNARGLPGTRIGDLRLRPLTFTAMLDHHQPFGRDHALDLGLSLLGARRPVDDRLRTPAPIDLDLSGMRLAPRAAWTWRAADSLAFTLSASRSYEPPTYSDLIFPAGPPPARILRSQPLSWQRADSLELGATGSHGSFSWSSTAFQSWWKNELLRLTDASGNPLGTVNADRTIHRGLETTLAWQPPADGGTAFSLRATHTWLHATFDGDPAFGDRRLGGTTPHTGWIEARAITPEGWFVTPSVSWQAGTTFADHAGNLGYSRGAIWSLEIGRRHPRDGWTAALGISNVFDRRAIAGTAGVLDRAANPGATPIFLPAAGRTWHLTLTHQW